MSGDPHDLNELMALWCESSPEEEIELRRIARRTTLRGMIADHADLGIAALLAIIVAVALIMRPTPATGAIGLVTAAMLLWSSWKRHLLRQNSRMLKAQDRGAFLDLETARTTSELKRAVLGLWFIAPATALGIMLAYSIANHGSLAGLSDVLIDALMTVPTGPAVIAGVITLIWHQYRLVYRLRRELEQLQGLKGEYLEEARLDRIAMG